MKIALHNLIFSGHHGLTSKEKQTPQKFKVNISIIPWRTVPIEEDMSKTVDYQAVKDMAQKEIEETSCDLLETLANRIALRILQNPKVFRARVTIDKLEIWKNGFPSVSVTRSATHHSELLDLDINAILHELMHREEL